MFGSAKHVWIMTTILDMYIQWFVMSSKFYQKTHLLCKIHIKFSLTIQNSSVVIRWFRVYPLIMSNAWKLASQYTFHENTSNLYEQIKFVLKQISTEVSNCGKHCCDFCCKKYHYAEETDLSGVEDGSLSRNSFIKTIFIHKNVLKDKPWIADTANSILLVRSYCKITLVKEQHWRRKLIRLRMMTI